MSALQVQQDFTDVATVEQQIEAIAIDIELTEKVAFARIGERLREAKELFAYDRREGGFQGWVRSRLNRSEEWARQAIIVHQAIASGNFQPQLELLSQKAQFEAATAEPDVQTIIAERVAAGEVFTAAQVKDIKAQAAQDAKEAHFMLRRAAAPSAGRGNCSSRWSRRRAGIESLRNINRSVPAR